MGERGDIIRQMQREFSRLGAARAAVDQTIYDARRGAARPLVGRVLARGLADEHADRHFLLVDGVDGRTHYVAIGRPGTAPGGGADLDPSDGPHGLAGAIVRIDPVQPAIRAVDRTIATVAAANGGRYDIDAHLRHDPSATQAFAETHVRRLEAMRRQGGVATRAPSGQWLIADDHLDRVAAYENARARDNPVRVTMLSSAPLDILVEADAATWIDRTLVAGDGAPLRDAGFGAELRVAQTRRRAWLMAQGFGQETGEGVRFDKAMLATLQRRELLRMAQGLGEDLGRPFVEAREEARIEGIYRRRLELLSGRFAVIERARDFTLVPWRPALERQTGKAVSGILRGDGVNWSIGRARSGPAVS